MEPRGIKCWMERKHVREWDGIKPRLRGGEDHKRLLEREEH